MRAACVLACLALFACPPPVKPNDSGVDDSGTPDAGTPDAGTPDAGTPDAGPDAGTPRPDAGPPDGGFTRVAIEDWCATQALSLCERDLRCLRVSQANLADCLARRADGCDQLAYTAGVQGGRLQYLATEAATCLNGYWSGSCEDPPTACADVFQGLVPPDGGCVLAEECSTAGFCYLYDSQCPHRCRAFEDPGASCDNFFHRCDPASAACMVGDAGAQVCLPPKNEGEACASWDNCRSDLACIGGHCIKRQVGPGEPCGITQGYPTCDPEYFCRQPAGTSPPPGTCQRRAGVGGTCAGSGSCLPSLRCSTVITTGVCEAKSGVGVRCANYDDCEDGLYCSGTAGACLRLPADGGDCSSRESFYRCATGFFCRFDVNDNDTCEASRTVGADCTYAGQCLSNECVYGTLPDGGYGGRCVPPCAQRADGGF